MVLPFLIFFKYGLNFFIRYRQMIKTGSQILLDALIREGVEYVFGIPGGVVLPFI